MLSELDERILTLKAALWENGNINRLLSKAIRSYIDHDAPKRPTADSDVYINGKKIIVKGIPHKIQNNELQEDLLVMAALEDAIEIKLTNVPKELEFESLLK